LLEATRQAVARQENCLPEFEVLLNHLLEADDGMIIDAHRLGEHGVVKSEDKDLRMTPFNFWEHKKGKLIENIGFGSLFLDTSAATTKCLGYGHKFFWAQMLMGDTADNIAGLTRLDGALCGPVAAFRALDKLESEAEVANFVIDAYRRNNQNPYPEAYLLWLLRSESDSFHHYLSACDLSPENRLYSQQQCARTDWWVAPQPKEEFEDVDY
jgi:hypothetical protein